MEKISNLLLTFDSLKIFVCYIIFCSAQGMFVKASQSKEGYQYNIVSVVFLTESTKLILTHYAYLKNNSYKSLWNGIRNNLKIFCLYLIPSFLYCIYNNFAFVNLSHFDPTTYNILLQLRVVVTGILFQLIFKKKFTKTQWLSLLLLTCGCMIQEIKWDDLKYLFSTEKQLSSEFSFFTVSLGFIFIQILCACFAGVYNEHILKETGASVNVFIQNIFMYVNSIFWNLLVLSFQGKLFSAFSVQSLNSIFQPLVIAIILNNSLAGITTSLFLQNLNSILKNFASALEIILVAILSWIIFGIEIKFNTFLAIFVVIYSLYLYSKNPVLNKGKTTSKALKEDEDSLLEEV